MRFDEIDGEDVKDPGTLSAFARAVRQGLNPFWDEMAGGVEAWKQGAQRLSHGELQTPAQTRAAYRAGRDASRAADDEATAYHPAASTAGSLAGGLAQGLGLPAGRAASVLGRIGHSAAAGAGAGAAAGLGGSRADLTDADMTAYVRSLTDTAHGAGLGAALGGGLHAVGEGVRAMGQKAAGVLQRARGQMVAEEGEALAREAADREAPELARREKEAAALERAQGQAMEMNKSRDARAERAEDRAANARTQVVPGMRAAPAARPRAMPTPDASIDDTALLRGYQGSAGERRAVNYDRVQDYRQRLSEGVGDAERERLGRYIAQHGDAVDDPGAFERRRIEQELRKRYPAEEVERVMRERVRPDGSILSRAEMDTTQPGTMSDVVKQGRQEEVRRLGGGGSAWEDAPVTATEQVPRAMSEDPTRMALIRTSPEQGFEGLHEGGALHTFEFKPRGSQEVFEVLATEPSPGVVAVDTVKPARASSVEELHGEVKNSLGPASMRELMQELARAFPGAKRITGDRMTGANVGHAMDVRAPEVTQPLGLEDVVRQGRAEDVRRMGGGGSVFEDARPGTRTQPEEMAAPEDFQGELPPQEVARYSPLSARPTLQPGMENLPGLHRERPMPVVQQEREPTVNVRRPTQPPEPQPPSAAEPTRNLRAPRPALEDRMPAPPAVPPPRGAPSGAELANLQAYLDEVLAAPDGARARAGAREAGALGDVARAGFQGLQGANNSLGAVAGAVSGVGREALRSPAVRARALSMLQVERLARVQPAVFARVGRSLQAALQQGPEEYATAVHVLNQTDPAFRAANRKAEEDVQGLSDEQLEAELRTAGLLR